MAVGQRTRRLVIEATMNEKGVVTGAKKVETSTEKMGRSVSKAGTAVKVAMGVVAAGAVVQFGKAMANHVAVMESVERRTDQVFGSMSDDVRQWAGANAAAFGLSENGVLNLASAFGDLLIPMGFTRQETAEMTKTTLEAANALSEWTGGQVDTATAAEAVQKAMLGEREMLKTLGISILESDVKQRLLTKGQKELTGAALQQAKAIATQELIFEKSADALNAYAEGGDSALKANKELASTVAELKDELGTQLAPVIAAAVGGLGDMAAGAKIVVDWFNNLDDTAKKAALAIGGLILVMTLAKTHPVLVGLALVAGALQLIGSEAKEAEQEVSDLAAALAADEFTEELLGDLIGEDKLALIRTLIFNFDELGDRIADGSINSQEFRDQLIAAAKAAGFNAEIIGAELAPALQKLERVSLLARLATEAEAEAIRREAEAMELSEKAARAAANANRGEYTPSLEDATDAADDTEAAVRNLSDALLAQADPFFAAVDAVDSYQKALIEAHADGKITRDELFLLGKSAGTARAKFEEFQQTAGSYEAAMELFQDATGLSRKAIEDLINEGETLDGSAWNASFNVSTKDFNDLKAISSDIAQAARLGITLDLSSLRLATGDEIERAVQRAILGLQRRGVTKLVPI